MITYCFCVIIYSYCPTPMFPSASKSCPLYAFSALLERNFRKLKNGCASLIMTKKQYIIIRIFLYAVICIFRQLVVKLNNYCSLKVGYQVIELTYDQQVPWTCRYKVKPFTGWSISGLYSSAAWNNKWYNFAALLWKRLPVKLYWKSFIFFILPIRQMKIWLDILSYLYLISAFREHFMHWIP